MNEIPEGVYMSIPQLFDERQLLSLVNHLMFCMNEEQIDKAYHAFYQEEYWKLKE